MTQQVIPIVGMVGKFTVNSPYEQLIDSNISYECIAVEELTGIISQGRNPYDEIYYPVGLLNENLDNDIKLNVKSVTLQSPKGVLVRIPASYISNMPETNGIKYTNVMVVAELCALPDSLSLTNVLNGVTDLIKSTFGINPNTKLVKYGQSAYLSQAEHIAVEAARARAINTSQTAQTQLLQYKTKYEDEKSKRIVLENYIKELKNKGIIT